MSVRDVGETAWELHGTGPAVALIHGFGLNRAMWQWQIPALAPHFGVLAYDLFGHGESAPPAGRPDLAMFSGQLLRLMDRCGIERAAVVGFSLGGMIARRFALDHPDRLSALAILHSAHGRTPAEREAVRRRVAHTREHGPAANVDSALERWFSPAFRAADPELIALIRRWITNNDAAVFPRIYRVLAEDDAEIVEGLERIACPTLVMTGEDDPGNTPAMSQAMAELIPGARLVILPGVRHMALAESPQAVSEPLCAFLREALASVRSRTESASADRDCEGSPIDLR